MVTSEILGFHNPELVGDGDTKTFQELQASNVYGDETPLKKIECTYHNGKRMGTALQKFVETEKKIGVTIGGSLRDTSKNTRQYRNFIIRHKSNIKAMK